MADEKFSEINESLLKYYQNAEIDKDFFSITKQDLEKGNLRKKGIL